MGDIIVEDGTFSVQGTGNALTTFIVHHYGHIDVTGGNFAISRGSQGGGTTTWYIYEGDFSMSNATTQSSTAPGHQEDAGRERQAGLPTVCLDSSRNCRHTGQQPVPALQTLPVEPAAPEVLAYSSCTSPLSPIFCRLRDPVTAQTRGLSWCRFGGSVKPARVTA